MDKKSKFRSDLTPSEKSAMYDESKVESVTMVVTVPLGIPYSNIKLAVTAKDPTNCRAAMIDILMNEIPARNAVDREYINTFVRNVLVKDMLEPERD